MAGSKPFLLCIDLKASEKDLKDVCLRVPWTAARSMDGARDARRPTVRLETRAVAPLANILRAIMPAIVKAVLPSRAVSV